MRFHEFSNPTASIFEHREVLDEMPIGVNLIGGTDPGAFRSDDIALATNPKARAKMHRVWHSSLVDVELYLLNTPGDQEHRDNLLDKTDKYNGQITRSVLRMRHSLDIQPKKDAITIILTQNEGDDRVPLTGWIIAHRMGHLFLDASRSGTLSGQAGYNIKPVIERLQRMRFDIQDMADKLYVTDKIDNRAPKAGGPIIDAIGTTKASRDGRLSAPGEIIPEAFAQYLLTGKVRFNHVPEGVETDFYGKSTVWHIRDQQALDQMNDSVQSMATNFENVFDAILKFAKGKIFTL